MLSIFRVTKKFSMILNSHQKIRVVEMAVLMIIGGLLEICSVSLVLPFMNMVMNPSKMMQTKYVSWICQILSLQSAREFLILVAVTLAFIYLLKNLYLIFEMDVQYRFVSGNLFLMQQKVLKSLLHRPYEYFLNINSGETVRLVNSDISNAFNLLSTLLSLFTEMVVSVMLAGTIFMITPFTAVCMAAVLLILLFLINRVIRPVLKKAGADSIRAGAGMNKWLLQSVYGIKELKVAGKEDYFIDNFKSYGASYVRAQRKNQILGVLPRFCIEAVTMSVMFLAVALFIFAGGNFETVVPVLSAAAVAAVRLLPSANRMAGSLASIAYNEPVLDKLMESLSGFTNSTEYLQTGTKLEHTHKIRKIQPLRKEILLKEITYKYNDSDKQVLNQASMIIRKGESIGIAGSSGAGKTTAVDILLGILSPQEGKVLADGIDIKEDRKGWLVQTGYIPQMIFMLDDTIRANVAFGISKTEISDKEVWKALKDASLDDFVKSLPNGLDTQIGERGVRLSGGQRQRVGIARALYKNPEILVFDEATSALDIETESAIMDSIHQLQGKKTMIIIAHRLTTIEACDHIFKVENGKIVMEK